MSSQLFTRQTKSNRQASISTCTNLHVYDNDDAFSILDTWSFGKWTWKCSNCHGHCQESLCCKILRSLIVFCFVLFLIFISIAELLLFFHCQVHRWVTILFWSKFFLSLFCTTLSFQAFIYIKGYIITDCNTKNSSSYLLWVILIEM